MKKRVISFFLVFFMSFSFCIVSHASVFKDISNMFEYSQEAFELAKQRRKTAEEMQRFNDIVNDRGGWSKMFSSSDLTYEDNTPNDGYLPLDKLQRGHYYDLGHLEDHNISYSSSTHDSLAMQVCTDQYAVSNCFYVPYFIPVSCSDRKEFYCDVACRSDLNWKVTCAFSVEGQWKYFDPVSQMSFMYTRFFSKPQNTYDVATCRMPEYLVDRLDLMAVSIEFDQPVTIDDISSIRIWGDGIHYSSLTAGYWNSDYNQSLSSLDIDIDYVVVNTSATPNVNNYCVSAGLMYANSAQDLYACPNADFFFFDLVDNDQFNYKFSINAREAANFFVRKHFYVDGVDNSDLTSNLYCFASVYDTDNHLIYFKRYPVLVSLFGVGAIIDTIYPNFDDYKPDPEPFPVIPAPVFNFTPPATYNDFDYQTINNYDQSQDFNSWVSTAYQTINYNISGGADTISENIKALGDNINAYFDSVKNYINNGVAANNDYLAELIKKFNNDFNNWVEASDKYLSDYMKAINDNNTYNTTRIIDAMYNQVVPDQDVMINICQEKFPLYGQLKTVFDDHQTMQKDLIISIPEIFAFGASGSDQSENVIAVQSVRNSDRNTDDSAEIQSIDDIDMSSEDSAYTYNITQIFRDYGLTKYRSLISVFVLASTFFAVINITFRVFGMGFDNDDG